MLNVRKGLIKALTPQISHIDGLSEHFRQFRLNKEQIERLILLAETWERQKTALVRIAEQEAPRWEKDHELLWGTHNSPTFHQQPLREPGG